MLSAMTMITFKARIELLLLNFFVIMSYLSIIYGLYMQPPNKINHHRVREAARHQQKLKISDVLKGGHKWTLIDAFKENLLKQKSLLQNRIEIVKKIQNKLFEDEAAGNPIDLEKNYNNVLSFSAELIQLNLAAHEYNDKWYIKFLSLFINRFKIKTLDREIDHLNKKIHAIQVIKNTSTLIEALNARVLSPNFESKGLFRIPGADAVSKKLFHRFAGNDLTKEFLNPELNEEEKFSNEDMASAIKKIFMQIAPQRDGNGEMINAPEETGRILQSKMDQVKDIEDARKAWLELPPVEQAFCKSCMELMANCYEKSWKPLEPSPPLENMFVAMPSLIQIFPNATFLVSNYQEIFK